MIEREKQRDDQQKKHAAEKKRRAHLKKENRAQPQRPSAGSDTRPETMEDKGYIKRIEEKTEKH